MAAPSAISSGPWAATIRSYDRDTRGGGFGGVTVDLGAGTATDIYGNTDTLNSIENVYGSSRSNLSVGPSTAAEGVITARRYCLILLSSC